MLGDDPLAVTKWDEIRDKLFEQKELVSKYWVDYQNGMEMFVNEEVVVGQLTAGRTRMGKAAGGPIDWTVPDEALDSPQDFRPWAQRAWEAALRKPKPKSKKRKASNRKMGSE